MLGDIRELLKQPTFLSYGRQPEVNFPGCQDSSGSQNFKSRMPSVALLKNVARLSSLLATPRCSKDVV